MIVIKVARDNSMGVFVECRFLAEKLQNLGGDFSAQLKRLFGHRLHCQDRDYFFHLLTFQEKFALVLDGLQMMQRSIENNCLDGHLELRYL